jgi:hypothetical protein
MLTIRLADQVSSFLCQGLCRGNALLCCQIKFNECELVMALIIDKCFFGHLCVEVYGCMHAYTDIIMYMCAHVDLRC